MEVYNVEVIQIDENLWRAISIVGSDHMWEVGISKEDVIEKFRHNHKLDNVFFDFLTLEEVI